VVRAGGNRFGVVEGLLSAFGAESLDVIRPNSVLRRPNRRCTPRLEVAHCLVSATIRPRLPGSASVLDGGTIIPSAPCISPGRWHFPAPFPPWWDGIVDTFEVRNAQP
jgi:hypothetical protein